MKGPAYKVPFRRRREGKTDYKARRAMVISRLPRVVTRASLKHMNVQIVEATITGDKVVASASSTELKNFGWKAACGNLPSAYLTGLLCGARAIAKQVKKAIADLGLHQPTKGSRVFASLKGVLDAGVDIPHKTDRLPDEKRVRGQNIVDYAESLASIDPELYQKRFSKYLEKKLAPEKIPQHFEATKRKITASSTATLKKQRTTKRTRRKDKKP